MTERINLEDAFVIGTRQVRANEQGQLEYRDSAGVRTVDPYAQLRNMARRQRDGASLDQIIDEFDLTGDARNPFILQRALARGRELLDQAIANGLEPAETPRNLDADTAAAREVDPDYG